jgi:gliding motility-associated-like protein
MYYLEVQGFCGITKDSILVIDGTTHAGFVASPDSGIAPLLVTISNQSQNAFVIEYKLNGIPVELNTENTLSLSKGGMNTITQIVTSESGCIDSVSTQVYVIEKLSIEIPNSFTPNADGFNDQFIIKNTGINLLECSIFNRWGAKITELKSPGATWDGLYNGKSAPDGVYFYVLKATAFNGEQLEKKGSITLIR